MPWEAVRRLLGQAAEQVAPTIVCRVEVGGEVVFEEAYGWLDPERRRVPASVDTLFDLASLTKLFTATAFLRLVDQGRVALDEPVAGALPECDGEHPILPAEDPLTKELVQPDPDWSGRTVDATFITFRRLLTHTSGLHAWKSLYKLRHWPPHFPMGDAERQARQQEAFQAVCGCPCIYLPGQGYAYSDIGFILLGFAVARLAGEEGLDRAISRLVTEPLGISAHFNPQPDAWRRAAPTEFCAWRKRRLQGEVHDENAAGMGGVAGHAGLFATAADVCRLGRLYLAGGENLLSAELVAESCREQVRTPEGVRRGLGWLLPSEPNPSCSPAWSPEGFGHTGFTGTSLWCDPERDLCVALLTNRVYHGR
ncbi:MAG: class A beta-lactamase-related serine hydrolase, partial [Caldilineae bacterium]